GAGRGEGRAGRPPDEQLGAIGRHAGSEPQRDARTEVEMTLQVGDRVEEQARSTERHARAGVIREVVHDEPSPRYRIQWDDGHESVYSPAAGSLNRLAAR